MFLTQTEPSAIFSLFLRGDLNNPTSDVLLVIVKMQSH